MRTTNSVESPFDSVRLRANAARHYKKIENATAMIWNLLQVAEKAWRRVKVAHRLRDVNDGQHFADGVRVMKKSKADD